MSRSGQVVPEKSAEVRPFRVDVPQSELDDLRDRLARTRWPRQLPGAAWSRGVPLAHLRELVEYWHDGYDWRAAEAALNAVPQFTTVIDDQQIHFSHLRSANPDAIGLIVTHSWPNSAAEHMRTVQRLGEHFHVVAPTLPGFGFSPFPEPADERPWSAERVARTWAELMRRLGYDRYGAHGNDAGALVSPQLAVAAPEHVIGVHITGGLGVPTGDPAEFEGLTEADQAELAQMAQWWSEGSGYGPYLAKRPQTLAYGWHDSPVAQLAWLVERFAEFDGGPSERIDRDQILTNASLYWLTGTGASSSWTYYEGAAGMPINQDLVPTGVSHGGPAALGKIAARTNKIVRWSSLEAGSHMVAMADPDRLVDDIVAFFTDLR
ncbi:epoxide hydrolase family protein [Pseudonocardia sp. TRM90224]|uniref:epoxide hydrolase family protein n=1 Tax=Pseudonocardia sp. TRM90224 TaxID=2812678 RepID=UPI001E28C068|nr:epoxide hydrolase [Pseudonocardia sp. TRM90224]